MAKFTPRLIKENVNVSKVSLKREFLLLSSGLIVILVTSYLLLGIILNILIDKIPLQLDHAAAKLFHSKIHETPEKYLEIQQEAQELLDEMATFLPESSLTYTVHVIEDEDVNAFAAPGGNIYLLSGLFAEVKSQNELAMILGHELGHYVRRDHLRALGRGIVFLFLSSVLFGTDSGVTDLVSGAMTTADLRFSRKQEAAADLLALELMNKKYGHVAGATDFFQRIHKKKSLPRFLEFFMTHPLGAQRVEGLNNAILGLNYTIGAKTPLSAIIQEQSLTKEESL